MTFTLQSRIGLFETGVTKLQRILRRLPREFEEAVSTRAEGRLQVSNEAQRHVISMAEEAEHSGFDISSGTRDCALSIGTVFACGLGCARDRGDPAGRMGRIPGRQSCGEWRPREAVGRLLVMTGRLGNNRTGA